MISSLKRSLSRRFQHDKRVLLDVDYIIITRGTAVMVIYEVYGRVEDEPCVCSDLQAKLRTLRVQSIGGSQQDFVEVCTLQLRGVRDGEPTSSPGMAHNRLRKFTVLLPIDTCLSVLRSLEWLGESMRSSFQLPSCFLIPFGRLGVPWVRTLAGD